MRQSRAASRSSRTSRRLRPSQIPAEGDERPTFEDRPFVVTAAEATKRLRVSLSWPGPADDYDLALFRRNAAGELEEVGTSGNPGPVAEEIVVEGEDLTPGDYVLRVTNYLAFEQEWHAKVERFEAGPDVVTPAKREAWTLTCEDADGTVLAQRQVFVDRGQAVNVGRACGRPQRAG